MLLIHLKWVEIKFYKGYYLYVYIKRYNNISRLNIFYVCVFLIMQ